MILEKKTNSSVTDFVSARAPHAGLTSVQWFFKQSFFSGTPYTRSIFGKNSIIICYTRSWIRSRGELIRLFDMALYVCMSVFLPALAAVIFRIKPFLRIPLPWGRVGLLISLVGTNNPLPIVSGDNERNSETKAIIYFWNGHLHLHLFLQQS